MLQFTQGLTYNESLGKETREMGHSVSASCHPDSRYPSVPVTDSAERLARDYAIYQLYVIHGFSTMEIAKALDISRQTVWRAVAKNVTGQDTSDVVGFP